MDVRDLVRVKPLNWQDWGVQHRVVVVAPGYTITQRHFPDMHFVIERLGQDPLPPSDTLEAAKAAAQADYESRILAALTPASGGRAGVLEALWSLCDAYRECNGEDHPAYNAAWAILARTADVPASSAHSAGMRHAASIARRTGHGGVAEAIEAAIGVPWTPPPEAERPEGYRCLGWSSADVGWEKVWWDTSAHGKRHWRSTGGYLRCPSHFMSEPPAPAQEGEG